MPTVPVSPRPKINLALGLLVGLALGIGLAVLRESLDTSIKSVEDLQNVMNTPVLGIIPEDNDARANPLISADQGNLRAEAYRQVRTNLQFIDVERSVKSVVITSAIPDEGKSTTACNLAIAFARTGARVAARRGRPASARSRRLPRHRGCGRADQRAARPGAGG